MNVFMEQLAADLWRVFIVTDFGETNIGTGSKEACEKELRKLGGKPELLVQGTC